MSISAINWAFQQKTGSPASKLVLIKLADNANDEGRCYPSLAYIAKHCEMHRATVIRHISALSERGFVDVEHRSVEGAKIPNVYHLKMQPLVADCDQGSRTLRPGVVADCDQGSRTLRHRTVIEPSVEPSLNLRDIAQPKITVEPKTTLTKAKVNPGGTRLPTDWVLSQALGEWALAEGLTRERIRQEADKFRDYWISKPGAAGRKSDWPATWRNWIRKATTGETGGAGVRSVRGNSLADSLTDTSWAR